MILGSSPLARGLQTYTAAEGAMDGIIPARAGFTRSSPSTRATAADHPRSRGVYDPYAGERDIDSGSSPLARGLQPERRDAVCWFRIIPARAGFTRP